MEPVPTIMTLAGLRMKGPIAAKSVYQFVRRYRGKQAPIRRRTRDRGGDGDTTLSVARQAMAKAGLPGVCRSRRVVFLHNGESDSGRKGGGAASVPLFPVGR